MKKFWLKKVIGCAIIGALAAMGVGFIVMGLWNHIIVAVLGVKLITYWQALGIFALSKLLFGGFGGGCRGCKGGNCKTGMKEKWQSMTPEEREQFKQDWRSRCSMWKKGGE